MVIYNLPDHIRPFWNNDYISHYQQAWLPTDNNMDQLDFNNVNQWFTHTYFRRKQNINDINDINEKQYTFQKLKEVTTNKPKKKSSNKKKKPELKDKGKRKAYSKKVLSDNESYRTLRIRMYPTTEQSKELRKWMAASRLTYNWALHKIQVMKKCGFKVSYNRIAIKEMVVPKKVIPKHNKNYKFLLEVPKDVRANAAFELAEAFLREFEKDKIGNVTFRSVKDEATSITIDTKALSRHNVTGSKEISFYTTYIKTPIKLRESLPEIQSAIKIKVYRNGKWYLHVPSVQTKSNERLARSVVSIDPGVKPFITYYSPTNGDAGYIGTSRDVEKLCGIGLKLDKIRSYIDTTTTTIKHRKRWSLRRCFFKYSVKMRNMVTDMQNKAVNYLTGKYDIIILPYFPVSNLVEQDNRRIGNKTVRSLLSWRHYSFRCKMKDKVEMRSNTLIMTGEAYTSKTCGNCGHIKDIGSNMIYNCLNCSINLCRQLNGGRNIYLKVLPLLL